KENRDPKCHALQPGNATRVGRFRRSTRSENSQTDYRPNGLLRKNRLRQIQLEQTPNRVSHPPPCRSSCSPNQLSSRRLWATCHNQIRQDAESYESSSAICPFVLHTHGHRQEAQATLPECVHRQSTGLYKSRQGL